MKIFTVYISILLVLLSECNARYRRSESENIVLRILPSEDQRVQAGKNKVLTCKADVPNKELLSDLKWLSPSGDPIPQDNRIYSEEQGVASSALFIKNLQENDSGAYTCSAQYETHELIASVTISIFVGITWVDAPTEQYARIHEDFKIRCLVQANPPANVDWLKESHVITGDQYQIEEDGLIIKQVSKENAGTYTCRARVAETGELEERDIIVDVQEPPVFSVEPTDVKGAELDKVEFSCLAVGSPKPTYTWVDWNENDVSEMNGWKVDQATGTLTASNLRKEDAGTYTCIATNNAGEKRADAELTVIIRPKIEELYNVTFPIMTRDARLTCKASGDPLPKIVWRKMSRSEPYKLGGQHDDDKIIIDEQVIEAGNDGQAQWMESTIIIDEVRRGDDGLYECQAQNEGGILIKSGHIQVEFKPTFEDQNVNEAWSWDQKPVTLTCKATAIPNATITWLKDDEEIAQDSFEKNYKINDHGAFSELIVTPLSSKYYGNYTCKADNAYGSAVHKIWLREAHEPSILQQSVLLKTTATTMHFKFVPPTDTGGLPILEYAAEYKEKSQEWTAAQKRVWSADLGYEYILENLEPETVYNVRFASKNNVGSSEWSQDLESITLKRGKPEAPILNENTDLGNMVGDVLQISAPDQYEVWWKVTENNGFEIDYFLLTYYPVQKSSSPQDVWEQISELKKHEIKHTGDVKFNISLDYPDTYYKIEIKAHNSQGFSEESSMIIKSGHGSSAATPGPWTQRGTLPLGPLIGGVVAVLILILVLVDLSCYKLNKSGITFFICKGIHASKKFDAKKESDNPSLRGQTITSTNGGSVVGVGFHEKEPLIEGQTKDSVVTVAKNGKTTTSVGKDSAV